MARDFNKISPAVWQSERFRNLPNDDARLTMLYMLTSAHMTSAGAYFLPDEYAAADLTWPIAKYTRARDELVTANMIAFDSKTHEVMIHGWFQHNSPANKSHLVGIVKQIRALKSEELRNAAITAVTPLDRWGVLTNTVSTKPYSLVDTQQRRVAATSDQR